jgi:AcrR family transcriptional regulator
MTAVRLTRKEKQQQTRDAIIEAATELLANHGVEGTSMEAIARHAGLTQGAIYSNFASKADLWWAIGEQKSRTIDLGEFLGSGRSLGDGLAAVGRALWQLLRGASRTELLLTQEFDLFLMRNPRARAKYARETRADVRRLAEQVERAASERSEPLPMDAVRLVWTIETVAYGLLHTFMLDPRAVDEELCVGAFTALSGHRPDPGLARC